MVSLHIFNLVIQHSNFIFGSLQLHLRGVGADGEAFDLDSEFLVVTVNCFDVFFVDSFLALDVE